MRSFGYAQDDNRLILVKLTIACHQLFTLSKFGKKPVSKPINGKNEQIQKTYSMLVLSATLPKIAEPIPAIPNAKPKNKPAIMPTFPGMSSCAYTKIAENADDRIKPIMQTRMPVQKRFI